MATPLAIIGGFGKWRERKRRRNSLLSLYGLSFSLCIERREHWMATILRGRNMKEKRQFNSMVLLHSIYSNGRNIETFNFQEGISNTYSGGHEFTLKFPILSSAVQIQAQQISRALKICSKCQSEWSTFVKLSLIIPQPTMVGDYISPLYLVRFTATPHHVSSCIRIWLRAASSNK